MATERTLSIIKPDGVAKNDIGEIYSRFEKAGLRIVAARMVHLSKKQTQTKKTKHKEQPFKNDLVKFKTTRPEKKQKHENDNADTKHHNNKETTNPKNATPNTNHTDFADSVEENAVHGSDAADTAKQEIEFFFKTGEICARTR